VHIIDSTTISSQLTITKSNPARIFRNEDNEGGSITTKGDIEFEGNG
jgi:hypothetical protein